MFIKNLSAVSLLILICTLSAAAQFTRVVTKSDKFDFGAGGTVSITGAPNGSIRVEPSTRNEIEINAEIKLSAPTEADLGLLEKVTGFLLNEGVGNVAINSVGTLMFSRRSQYDGCAPVPVARRLRARPCGSWPSRPAGPRSPSS